MSTHRILINYTADRPLVGSPPSSSILNLACELYRLEARIFSPYAMKQKGTKLKAALIRAKTVQDHEIPKDASILSTASPISAPAMLRVVPHAASAEAAYVAYASVTY